MQTITTRQRIDATVTGLDQYGQPFDITGLVTAWTTDDAGNAILKALGDPSKQTVTFEPVSADEAGGSVDVTVTVTGANGDVFTAVDTLVVNPAAAPALASVQIVWGTPTQA